MTDEELNKIEKHARHQLDYFPRSVDANSLLLLVAEVRRLQGEAVRAREEAYKKALETVGEAKPEGFLSLISDPYTRGRIEMANVIEEAIRKVAG